MLDLDYIKTLQFRWDVYLLTNFFKHPGYKVSWLVDTFIQKHKLTMDDYLQLKRIPRGFIPASMRVEPFVANSFSKLSKIIYQIKLEDVFDIALKLKNSKIDTKANPKISMIDTKDYRKAYKQMKINLSAKEFEKNLYESQKASNQWHITK